LYYRISIVPKPTILMKILIAIVMLFAFVTTNAQLKIPKIKSAVSIKPDIEKVAKDYYQQFHNITGDTLMRTSNSIEFRSKLLPVGAVNSSITKFIEPRTLSWQAVMFQAENFEEAVTKYKQYYRQLNGMSLNIGELSNYKLIGEYDAPDEGRGFASSILELQNSAPHLKQFKIEIGLNYSLPEWTVKIMVYEKLADEDVRPTM